MSEKYYLQSITAIEPLDGYIVKVTFADGFTGSVDLSPLIGRGPIFEPLRDIEYFRKVHVSEFGAPEWSEKLDLSPGSLRAWCEAGRFMDYDETDRWIEQHSGPAQEVA